MFRFQSGRVAAFARRLALRQPALEALSLARPCRRRSRSRCADAAALRVDRALPIVCSRPGRGSLASAINVGGPRAGGGGFRRIRIGRFSCRCSAPSGCNELRSARRDERGGDPPTSRRLLPRSGGADANRRWWRANGRLALLPLPRRSSCRRSVGRFSSLLRLLNAAATIAAATSATPPPTTMYTPVLLLLPSGNWASLEEPVLSDELVSSSASIPSSPALVVGGNDARGAMVGGSVDEGGDAGG